MSIAEKLITIAENEANVYSAGEKAEWNAFWDALQQNGARTDYGNCFRRWSDSMLKPKYNITVKGNGALMFTSSTITNMKKLLEDCGVVLDLSGATSLGETFAYNTKLTRLPYLNLNSCTNASYMASGCRALCEIEGIHVGATSQNWTGSFTGCTSLEKVIFSGTIVTNIGFPDSTKLSKASMKSIVSCLSDSVSGKTVTFHSTAKVNAFTDEEWAALIATKPNWTFSLV